MKQKKSSLELEPADEALLRRIYKSLWDEIGERPSNVSLWFLVLQEFLEITGYEIVKKEEKMKIKLDKQNHELGGVVYPGTFSDLLAFLELKGIKFEFVAPGLKNSKGVLILHPDDETWQKAYDQG